MYRHCIKKLNDLSTLSAELSEYLRVKGETDKEIFYDIKLAIFELAGNILQHSKSAAEVSVELDCDRVYINVVGGNCFDCKTVYNQPDIRADHGRGIFIVKSIAESLNYYQNGKTVLAVISRKRQL